MTEPPIALSVIIANYNYAEFVGVAIESALAIDWPDLEVIVVDDGSTDNSRAVIEEFGERVIAIFQENAGQIAARNLGFARSRGDAIILLDSDDVLHPSIMREVARVWHRGVSKVQFRMRGIDAEGKPNGSVFPQYRENTTPAEVRRWATATGSYPAPPCSGNLFSRASLEAIFPLDDCCGKAPDTCCVAAAPFLGEVMTIAKPLADYRVHGRNDGAMSTLDRSRFGWQTVSAIQRFEYSQRIARRVGIAVSDRGRYLAFAQLRTRVASYRLAPEGHPIQDDSTARILLDLFRAALTPQGASLKETLTTVVWGALVLFSPRSVAETLVHWRFSPGARPPALRNALSAMGIVR